MSRRAAGRRSASPRRASPATVAALLGKGTATKSPAALSSNRPFSTSSRLSAPSSADLPVGAAAAPAIFAARDRLGLVGDLGEALAEGRRRVGEGLDQGLAERGVVEAAAGRSASAGRRRGRTRNRRRARNYIRRSRSSRLRTRSGWPGPRAQRHPPRRPGSRKPPAALRLRIEPSPKLRRIVPREPRLVAIDEQHLVAPVEDRAGRRGHHLGPGIAVAEAVVAQAQAYIGCRRASR